MSFTIYKCTYVFLSKIHRKCQYATLSSEEFENHKLTHGLTRQRQYITFMCPICNCVVSGAASIKTHKLSHSKSIRCQYCEYSTDNKSYLKKHADVQHFGKVRTYKCDIPGCVITTTCTSNLEQHRRTHLGEEQWPFVCPVEGCDKRFKRKYDLTAHSRIHTSKMFACTFEGCHHKTNVKSSLYTHQQTCKHRIVEAEIVIDTL